MSDNTVDKNRDFQEKTEEFNWSAFYDDEGRIYYYNEKSGESSWDAPARFNPPPNDAAEQSSVKDVDSTAEDNAADASKDPDKNNWVLYHDDEGREYFFNTLTEETTWEKPVEFEKRSEKSPDEASTVTAKSPEQEYSDRISENIEDDDSLQRIPAKEHMVDDMQVEEKQTEPEVIVDQLEVAEQALKLPDAILEPGVMTHLTEIVSRDDGNPERAIQALSKSYNGTTAVCGLLSRWLADLKSLSAVADVVDTEKRRERQSKAFRKSTDDIREMAQAVIFRISREKFTNGGGDNILNLHKAEVAFLEKMMDSKRWRGLLIDLSASNKDSAMLRYCLRAISKRGHHREIANRIDQSDHFAVFDAMLASEVAAVGKIAVSLCQEQDSTIHLDELVSGLRRTCTSTAYTYIFTLEVLDHLVTVARRKAVGLHGKEYRVFLRAIRKWERLGDDLKSSMIDPASTNATPLFRKRRLDVAMTISELHQRQRRRTLPDGNNITGRRPVDEVEAKRENAVHSFLRQYSLSTRVDDSFLDSILESGSTELSANSSGALLVKRPISVKALLGYLYKPGGQRVGSVVTKKKCAMIIAHSAIAAENEITSASNEQSEETIQVTDKVALTRNLVDGSNLCQELENMVSFIVTQNATKKAQQSSGERLVVLATGSSLVAHGVAMWARNMVKGNDFVSSGTYATVSPSILSLVRVLYTIHKSLRDDSLEVAFSFLSHSNTDSDVSYQKLNEIKEQSLRLLLVLSVAGESPTALLRMTQLLEESGSSALDSSLIRYFVSGLLSVIQGPFSIPFMRTLAAFLKVPSCVDALKTSYFEATEQAKLSVVMNVFRQELDSKTAVLNPEDIELFLSLLSNYATTRTE
ncbi:unnamed protein product [Cylindrotheca closterium]|uniref:WW domain-containing protein n=1 Tax=Cylindrotheca closterium TaxID=2856 RepID=A0AAD2G995_9STRA|nr:unnamed protein product [Cylindrotheca closterium]